MINAYKIVLFVFSLFFLIMGKAFAQVSPVEFRFACDGPNPGCSREFVERSGDELWVENKSVFDIDDIESASVDSRPEFVEGIKVGEKVYAIGIKFKDQIELEDVTSKNLGKRLGIFIDHKLIIAPLIREAVTGGNVGISVDPYDDLATKHLVDFINNAVHEKRMSSDKNL